ncbi:MAG: hypothetical protein U1C46_12010, partial [Bacteroidales bacterium]|nr:hypothetical protein [Bacteroidales bacterium]
MKNIFKIPILILLAVLFSCNKKDISSNYEVKTFRKAPDAIEALIKNPNNIEDENLNKFLYNYARAILNVVNYPDLLKIIINESKKSEDNVI